MIEKKEKIVQIPEFGRWNSHYYLKDLRGNRQKSGKKYLIPINIFAIIKI